MPRMTARALLLLLQLLQLHQVTSFSTTTAQRPPPAPQQQRQTRRSSPAQPQQQPRPPPPPPPPPPPQQRHYPPPPPSRAGGKRVAVLGTAGYAGACTFGFLQRARQEGLIDHVSALGATAETADELNAVLQTSGFETDYCNAQKGLVLANFFSVPHLVHWLQGYDALVLGTDLGVAVRPTTPGTFGTSNGLTCEVYWPAPKEGLEAVPENWTDLKRLMMHNLLLAAQHVRTVRHIILVDDAKDITVQQAVHATGIPYTCLGPTAVKMQQYTDYRAADMGVLAQSLTAEPLRARQQVGSSRTLHREDLSALAVQALLTVDWNQSRCVAVTEVGGAGRSQQAGQAYQQQQRHHFGGGGSDMNNGDNPKWCPNAHLLERALEEVVVETAANTYAYY